MPDDTSRGFPWFRLAFGGISILVLVGTFGGFMWLLRTYVDPPRVASGPSAAALLASVSNSTNAGSSERRVPVASRDDTQNASASLTEPGLPAPSEPYERAPPPPNAGAPIPSWTSSPLPGTPRIFNVASSSPPASAPPLPPPAEVDTGTVSFAGPVPLPRPKPRMTARAANPAAAVSATPTSIAPTSIAPPTAAPQPRPKPPA